MRHQPEEILLKLAAGLLVHRRERLVHQQHLGIDECARQPDPLAHAARQCVRIGILESFEADLTDISLRHPLALRLGNAAQLETESHIAHHARPASARNPGTRRRAGPGPVTSLFSTSTLPLVDPISPAMILSKLSCRSRKVQAGS